MQNDKIPIIQVIKSHFSDLRCITEPAELEPFQIDNRRQFQAPALALIYPKNTQDVVKIIHFCHHNTIALVPQGGNTSHVGGSVPIANTPQIIIHLGQMNKILTVNPIDRHMIVESGCTLEAVKTTAEKHNLMFPLDLASGQSCTIGGNLSTNAGGNSVLQYGNARDLCLGIEAVLANGHVFEGITSLRKNNIGYNLNQLLIGAEGTLGIITKASLKLFAPTDKHTALIELNTFNDVLTFFNAFYQQFSQLVCACEYISNQAYELIVRHFPNIAILPTLQDNKHLLLVEIAIGSALPFEVKQSIKLAFENFVANQTYVTQAIIAQNKAQAITMWKIRENLSRAQTLNDEQITNIKHDIGIPLTHMQAFMDQCEKSLRHHFGHVRIIVFGHIGDGNLHYNISSPQGTNPHHFLSHRQAINTIVYDLVQQFHGTFSAEHGIGQLKSDTLKHYHGENYMHWQQAIKHALDPNNLMNPGKIFPTT